MACVSHSTPQAHRENGMRYARATQRWPRPHLVTPRYAEVRCLAPGLFPAAGAAPLGPPAGTGGAPPSAILVVASVDGCPITAGCLPPAAPVSTAAVTVHDGSGSTSRAGVSRASPSASDSSTACATIASIVSWSGTVCCLAMLEWGNMVSWSGTVCWPPMLDWGRGGSSLGVGTSPWAGTEPLPKAPQGGAAGVTQGGTREEGGGTGPGTGAGSGAASAADASGTEGY